MTDHTDQQAAGEDTSDSVAGEEVLELATEDQGDLTEGDGAQDDDEDEVEFAGKTFRAPKALKEKLSALETVETRAAEIETARQAFETQQREQIEAFQQRVEFQKEFYTDTVHIKQLESELAKWRAFEPRTQAEVEERREAIDAIKEEREQAGQALDVKWRTKQAADAQQAQQADAKALTTMRAEVAKQIPKYSPELETKIAQAAQTEFGFKPQELGEIRDPRIVRALHYARIGLQAERQSQQRANVQKQQEGQPSPKVRGAGGRFGVSPDTDDFTAFEKHFAGAKA